ncbi:MAG: hypothetical protein AB2A00_23900 [Myxococcota bacterium]
MASKKKAAAKKGAKPAAKKSPAAKPAPKKAPPRAAKPAKPAKPAARPAAKEKERKAPAAPPARDDVKDKLVALLASGDGVLRLSAGRVVAALGVQHADVEPAAAQMMASGDADEVAVAAHLAGACGLAGLAPALVRRVGEQEPVGPAAREAIKQLGEVAVGAIKAALPKAEGQTRSQLMSLLASLGGIKTFQGLLDDLLKQDIEEARATALAVRRTAKGMAPAQRLKLLEALRKFLQDKRVVEHPIARPVTVRLLGYLELPEAVEDLLPLVVAGEERNVRVEALQGLRLCLPAQAEVPGVLREVLAAVTDSSPEVAAAALGTAMNILPDASNAPGVARVLTHGNKDASRWASEALQRLGGAAAGPAVYDELVTALKEGHSDHAFVAARALKEQEGGADLLIKALLAAPLERRSHVERALLDGGATTPSQQGLDTLAREAMRALLSGEEGAAALCTVWRAMAPDHHAGTLRGALAGEQDHKRRSTIAAELGRHTNASAEDKLALAFETVRQGSKDFRAASKDPTLGTLVKLCTQGVDVASAMVRNRQLTPADWLYVGFRFCEAPESKVQAQGIDLLMAAKDMAGMNTDVGKAATNKLKLMGEL